jgi:hypothetical protein
VDLLALARLSMMFVVPPLVATQRVDPTPRRRACAAAMHARMAAMTGVMCAFLCCHLEFAVAKALF